MSDINIVGVVGCGLMGSGIVEVSARSGYTTIVREINDEALSRGMERIHKSTGRAVKRGKLSEEGQKEILDRISGVTTVDGLSDCDLIVEAATENLPLKIKIWEEIGKAKKDGALLATNTSSIPISKLAVATGDPEGFMGLHFMNPVPVMKLVEIVRGLATSDETYERGANFIKSLGKDIITAKDTPGFVINALLVPYLCEAMRMVESGVATPEDIDKGMVGGCNMPMGPLTLADFVGLDTTLSIADVLFDEFKDPKYAAPPLLRRMVELGRYGRKSGRGFYDYSK